MSDKNKGMLRTPKWGLFLVFISIVSLVGLGRDVKGEVLTLKESIDLALSNNIELAFLRNQRGVMALEVGERWGNYLPSLSLGYDYGYSTGKGLSDESRHTLNLGVKQPVWNGGRREAEIKSSQADYQLNLIAIERKEGDILLVSKRAYLRAMTAKRRLGLSHEMYDYANLVLETSRKEFDLGSITRVELLTVESGFNEAQLGLKKAQSDLKITLLELKGVLGLDGRRDVDVPGGLDDLLEEEGQLEADVERYISLGLRYRPEVRELKTRLSRDRAELDKAQGYFLPQINLNGGYSLSGENLPLRESSFSLGLDIGFSFSNNEVSGSLGGGIGQGNRRYTSQGLSLNPFGSNGNGIAILVAQIQLERSSREKEMMKGRIETEVQSAYFQAEEASIRREMVLKKIEIVKEQLKIEELKHRLGLALRSEVFEIQTRLTAANNEYVQALGNYFLALAQLERAVGVELVLVR